jgi:hypothetical protein
MAESMAVIKRYSKAFVLEISCFGPWLANMGLRCAVCFFYFKSRRRLVVQIPALREQTNTDC